MEEERPSELKDIKCLAEDLKFIKKAVTKSGSILQYMEVSKALRLVALATGALTILFSTLFYYFIGKHGSYEAIPSQVKLVLLTAVALAVILVGTLKIRNFINRAREVDEQITFLQFFEAIYTDRFLTLLIPFLFTMVALPLYFSFNGQGDLVMPMAVIIFGLLCLSLATIFYLRELIILGCWLIAVAFICLIWFPGIHFLLQLIFSFGVGFLIMSAGGYLVKPGKE